MIAWGGGASANEGRVWAEAARSCRTREVVDDVVVAV